jgi:hypothetical protein
MKRPPAFRIDLNDRETVSAYDELPLWSAMFGLLLLKHYFIRLGFLDGWKGVLRPEEQEEAFSRLEANLNAYSERRGELSLTIPMAYVEGVRAP